jgi:Ca2+-binding RTX toxin-like protein
MANLGIFVMISLSDLRFGSLPDLADLFALTRVDPAPQSSAGDDIVDVTATTTGFGTLDGGAGTDTLRLNPASPQISGYGPNGQYLLSVGAFNAPGTTVTSFERFVFNSTVGNLFNPSAPNTMAAQFAYGGNNNALNQIGTGLAANSEIVGGAGNDSLNLIYNSANLPGSVTAPSGFTYTNWTTPTRAYLPGDRVNVTVSGSGATTIYGTAHSGVQGLNGGAGDDIIYGSDDMDSISGGAGGADQLHGGGGDDALSLINTYVIVNGTPSYGPARTGAGTLFDGGDGTDFLVFGGSVDFQGTVQSIEGLYLIPQYFNNNSPSAPVMLGSQYYTDVFFSSATFATLPTNLELDGVGSVVVTMGNGGETFDGTHLVFDPGSYISLAIEGGSGDDHITAAASYDYLDGNDGNDILIGGGGIDTLDGGAGNDRMVIDATSSGSDIYGGSGTDTLVVTGGAVSLDWIDGVEAVELQNGAALTLNGFEFNTFVLGSTLSGTGSITINMAPEDLQVNAQYLGIAPGSAVSFTINGSSDSDTIKGSVGAVNTIDGGDGPDQIRGGSLGDIITGGAGDDKIIGARGADILTGGDGSDTFRYQSVDASGLGAAADRITDFVSGVDHLGFRGFDANPNTPQIDTFSYIDTQAFHATGAAEIRYETAGADLVVQVDVNGDGVADMAIYLSGLGGTTLHPGDFLI